MTHQKACSGSHRDGVTSDSQQSLSQMCDALLHHGIGSGWMHCGLDLGVWLANQLGLQQRLLGCSTSVFVFG